MCLLTQQSFLLLRIKCLMSSIENKAVQKNNCHLGFDIKVVNDKVLYISTFLSLVIACRVFNHFKGIA